MDEERYRQIKWVLWLVLALNWGVALAKVFYGMAIKSASMTADGYHSFADGASNIIGLVGVSLAARPADDDHPYGHKKYETFTAIGIAMLLVIVVLNILQSAWSRLLHPVVPEVQWESFVVMLLTLSINIGVMTYERRRGKQLGSDILITDSMHTTSDIYVSISVLATLVFVKLGLPWLDVVAALVIAVLIGRSAYEIIRQTSDVLCDTARLDVAEIARVVMRVDGVLMTHRIRTRGREDDLHVDLHVLVDPKMSVDESHALAHHIDEVLRAQFAGVSHVIAHVEPYRNESSGTEPTTDNSSVV